MALIVSRMSSVVDAFGSRKIWSATVRPFDDRIENPVFARKAIRRPFLRDNAPNVLDPKVRPIKNSCKCTFGTLNEKIERKLSPHSRDNCDANINEIWFWSRAHTIYDRAFP